MTSPLSPLRTLIIDDEPLAVERMEALCAPLDAVTIIGSASDGKQALAQIAELQPDLLLLDMTMPVMDGLSLSRELAKMEQAPAIIFITAHDHFAVEAFDTDAVDYVLKPVSQQRLARALDRAVKRNMGGPDKTRTRAQSPWLEELWVPCRNDLIRIDVARINRIDAERDYVRLHVNGNSEAEPARSYLLLQTLSGLEERLDPEQFVRIHRSTLIQRDYIRALRHDGMGVWSVETRDGEFLRIGRTHLPKVKIMITR